MTIQVRYKRGLLITIGNYTKPIEAYIIFENEEAYQRSLKMNYTRICC
jgi:hypothetical protein